jgi:hypothetical protein
VLWQDYVRGGDGGASAGAGISASPLNGAGRILRQTVGSGSGILVFQMFDGQRPERRAFNLPTTPAPTAPAPLQPPITAPQPLGVTSSPRLAPNLQEGEQEWQQGRYFDAIRVAMQRSPAAFMTIMAPLADPIANRDAVLRHFAPAGGSGPLSDRGHFEAARSNGSQHRSLAIAHALAASVTRDLSLAGDVWAFIKNTLQSGSEHDFLGILTACSTTDMAILGPVARSIAKNCGFAMVIQNESPPNSNQNSPGLAAFKAGRPPDEVLRLPSSRPVACPGQCRRPLDAVQRLPRPQRARDVGGDWNRPAAKTCPWRALSQWI